MSTAQALYNFRARIWLTRPSACYVAPIFFLSSTDIKGISSFCAMEPDPSSHNFLHSDGSKKYSRVSSRITRRLNSRQAALEFILKSFVDK
jgi:hypothetical protein